MVDQLDAIRQNWLVSLSCNDDIDRVPTDMLLEFIDMGVIAVKADGYALTELGLAMRAHGECAGSGLAEGGPEALPPRACFDIDASMHDGETRRQTDAAAEDDPDSWEIL